MIDKTHIGIFEGIGMFSLAARKAGYKTIAICEIDPFCQRVLKYHFPNANLYSDAKTTDYTIYRNQCGIFTAGFPCQPYSVAGQRKGVDDNRFLWPHTIRAITEIQPDVVILENVAGLLSILEPESISKVENEAFVLFGEGNNDEKVLGSIESVERRVIATIIKEIEAAGYDLPRHTDGTPIVLCIPACAVNAPHRRDRVWFVAYSKSNGNRGGLRQLEGENGCKRESEEHRQDYLQHRNDGEKRITTNPNSNGYEQWQSGKNRQETGESTGKQNKRKRIWGNIGGTGEQGSAANPNSQPGGQQCQQPNSSRNPQGGDKPATTTNTTGNRSIQGQPGRQSEQPNPDDQAGRTDTNNNNGRCEEPVPQQEQYQPESWQLDSGAQRWQNFPTQSPLCSGDDGYADKLVDITFSKWRNESIKACGNAIVHQIALELINAIDQAELEN